MTIKVTKLMCSFGLMVFSSYINAAIINFGATIGNNSTTIALSAGMYNVTPVGIADGGLYDGWSAWSFTSGCDVNGENCETGWLNTYRINSTEFSEIFNGGSGRFLTPLLALDNAPALTSFTLNSSANVSFTTTGSTLSDNRGGISLDIQPNTTSVPAPAAVWLIGSGLIGFIGMRRKSKKL